MNSTLLVAAHFRVAMARQFFAKKRYFSFCFRGLWALQTPAGCFFSGLLGLGAEPPRFAPVRFTG